MIELQKKTIGQDRYMILLNILGDSNYEAQLLTVGGMQVVSPGQKYQMPYTKEAYAQFKLLQIPFRTQTSNSDSAPSTTDNTSIGTSRPTVHTLVEGDKPRADIAKVEDRWKLETSIDFRSGVFSIKIPYMPTALSWVKGLDKAYWSPNNKRWIAKGTPNNLVNIQKCLAVYTVEKYELVSQLILAAYSPKKVEIWRSPAEKDCVYIKAAGQGVDLEPIKRVPGRTYDKQYKRWTIPYDAACIKRLVAYYLANETKVNYRLAEAGKVYQRQEKTYGAKLENLLSKIEEVHRPWVQKYADTMIAQRYSHKSISQYVGKFVRFLDYYVGRSPIALTAVEVNDYLTRLSRQDVSDSTLNMSISALRFYYTKVEYLPSFQIERIRRPRKGTYLPTILTQTEVSRMLEACSNLKHSSILYTLYSSGIRLSEILDIRLTDIYWERNQIFVRGAKGKKDRVVQLSEVLKEVLHLYFDTYKPIYWLYEGQDQETQYSSSSVQKMVRRAAKKVGIQRSVTPHVLRHCYATHLHDGGTSIRFIQELLGHKNIKTTLIYTHVSTHEVSQIVSPLDKLGLKVGKNRNEK